MPLALQKKYDGSKTSGTVLNYEDLDEKQIADEYITSLKQQLYFLEMEHSALKASQICSKCAGAFTGRGLKSSQGAHPLDPSVPKSFVECYSAALEEKMRADEAAGELQMELEKVQKERERLLTSSARDRLSRERLEHDLQEAGRKEQELQTKLQTKHREEMKSSVEAVEESLMSVDVATLYSLQSRITQLEVDKCVQDNKIRGFALLKQQSEANQSVMEAYVAKIIQENSQLREEAIRLSEEVNKIKTDRELHEQASGKWSVKIVELQKEVAALKASRLVDPEELERQKKDVAELKLCLRQTKATLELREEAVERLEVQVAQNQEAEASREAKHSALRHELADKEAALKELSLRLTEMEAATELERSQNSETSSKQIKELTKQLRDKTQEAAKLQDSLKTLMQNLHG